MVDVEVNVRRIELSKMSVRELKEGTTFQLFREQSVNMVEAGPPTAVAELTDRVVSEPGGALTVSVQYEVRFRTEHAAGKDDVLKLTRQLLFDTSLIIAFLTKMAGHSAILVPPVFTEQRERIATMTMTRHELEP